MFALHTGQVLNTNQSGVGFKFSELPAGWLDAEKAYSVRDLFKHADVGTVAAGEGGYTLASELAPISSRMLLFTPL